MLTIALTGGIGSGKSTVATLFSRLGVPVIDSDIIAREIVEPGMPILQQIADEFGNDILTPEQHLDRKKLARIVFSDPDKKKKLEKLLHPAIYHEIENRIKELDFPYCIIVIPLLVETGAINRFNRVLVVDVPEETQLQRTAERDQRSAEFVRKIIKSQVSRKERLQYADDVIENNVTIDQLEQSVSELHQKYLALAEQQSVID